MKNLFKKVLTVVLTIALTILNVNTFSGTTVWAATVYQADVPTPSNGNVFVYVDGTFLSESSAKLLNRINEIRKEACKEGLINPETGKKLTMADYKPVVWCTTLEDYARLRAAEASINWSHTRPNKMSTFKNSLNKASVKLEQAYHSSENLAMGYGLLDSVNAYYSEKSLYKKNYHSSGAGHYSNIISPSHTLMGAAGFKQDGSSIYSAIEFGTLWKTSVNKNSQKQRAIKSKCSQIIEVNVSYLVKSLSISVNTNIKTKTANKILLITKLKNGKSYKVVNNNIKWKSSNTSVITINDKNQALIAVKKGSSNITASIAGKTVSYKITVKR